MPTELRLLRLFPDDNIYIATATIEQGETIAVDDAVVSVASTIPLGHKVAARAIAEGEKILKYGAPIGSATRKINPGEHVHTHNMQSDYLPTYAREGNERYVGNH